MQFSKDCGETCGSDAGCGDSDVSSDVLVVLFVEVKLIIGLVMII